MEDPQAISRRYIAEQTGVRNYNHGLRRQPADRSSWWLVLAGLIIVMIGIRLL